MSNLSNKRILIADFGMYPYVYEILAKSYEKVYLYIPWESSFPESNKAWIGKGLEGVERILDFDRYIDKADIIAFFDIYFAGRQAYLRKNKYRVFGAGDAEEIEVDREKFHEILKKQGLPVIPTEPITGHEKFLKYIKDKKEKYIKFSTFRGDSETHHWTSYEYETNWLNSLMHKVGMKSKEYRFLIQDNIEGDNEPGYDGWCIDGKFSPYCGFGYEVKDEGIIETVYKNEDLPKDLKYVNDAMASYFKDKKYRGPLSTECRKDKDGTVYFSDACTRNPSPPGEVMSNLFADDYAQMVWDIAEGKMPDMKPKAKHGAQIMLHSEWLQKEWLSVYYPKELNGWVHLRNKCVIDGVANCIPQDNVTTVGAVTAIADTVDEAVELCLERASQVKGEGIQFDASTFDKAKEYMEKAIS